MKKILTLILVACASCSGTSRIARGANEISALATSSKGRFEEIGNLADTGSTDSNRIDKLSTAGAKEQDEILAITGAIHEVLPSVEDETPWWADLISKVMVGLSILAVCFLLWYTGVGFIVRRILYSFGWMIPQSTRRDAGLAADVLHGKGETVREAIIARRAADPAFDKAFELENRKRKSDG